MVVNGDTIIIGAPHDFHGGDTFAGSAYVFYRNQGGSNNWGQVTKLTAFDSDAFDRFGKEVNLVGDLLSVGSRFDTHSSTNQAGSTYLFRRDEGGSDNWGLIKKIVADDPQNTDRFGRTTAFYEDMLIVSSHLNNESGVDSGSVYVFQQDQGGASNWGQVTEFTASDVSSNFQFGRSIDMDSDLLIIGARRGDTNVNNSGTAYIFRGDPNDSQSWEELFKLAASDGSTDDEFGFDVVIDGSTAVVGSPLHDDGGDATGAVYIYDSLVSLSLAKRVVPDVVEPGGALTYTVRFSNTGFITVSDAIITDIVPISVTNVSYINSGVMITPTGMLSYTWQVAEIPPGSGGIITITGVLDANLGSEGLITNTAVLVATDPVFGPLNTSAIFEVNIPPEIDIIRFYEINEGQSITLTGTITDPGQLDSFELVVNWGDGLTETLNYPSGTTAFNVPHHYADDDPTVTPVDEYFISLTLFDSDGAFDEKVAYATVHNVAPTVDIGADITILPDQTITFTGIFTDPGVLDTFTYDWSFGDGVTATGTLTTSHIYPDEGSYTVTLTVRDDDSGVGQDTRIVQVYQPKIFLPFVAYNSCHAQFNPVDVVLAIDASDSMMLPTESGGDTKFAAAKLAAISFLELLPFTSSQAAVVSFNDAAILEHPLAADLDGLTAAIQNIELDTLTRLDLALSASRSELLSSRRVPSHDGIVILLTDGIPAGTTEAEVLAEAEVTKAAGITIYTIGLGEDVNAGLLTTIATSSDHYYAAPSTSDLNEIYMQIANVIQCQE